MLGRKYVICRFLWAVGCICKRFDIGTGLASISPQFNKKK